MSATIYRFDPGPGDDSEQGSGGDSERTAPSGDGADPRIRQLLGRLPRERAGAGFTGRVLARTALAKARRRRLRSLAAAAAFCAFGAVGAQQWNESQGRRVHAEHLAGLQLEYRLLQQELIELERAAESRRPIVYLGGDGDVEYVIDLGRFAARRGASGPSLPAANTSSPKLTHSRDQQGDPR